MRYEFDVAKPTGRNEVTTPKGHRHQSGERVLNIITFEVKHCGDAFHRWNYFIII